jgi:PAP2 superfamily
MFPRELDMIKYGCATLEQNEWLVLPSYLDGLVNSITSDPRNNPPANSSLQTKAELSKLIENTRGILKNEESLDRYKGHDVGLVDFLKQGIDAMDGKYGIEKERVKRVIDDVLFDTLGLITKLKYHYQRPRPYQMAVYYELKDFHHHQSITIDSPSYPSGHAYMGAILSGVIGMLHPEVYEPMRRASFDFNFSRIFMGVHYKSDIDKGVEIAEMVLNYPQFKRKHKL